MIEADQVRSILTAQWNPVNTGNVTPVIDLIINRANVDLRAADYILLYNVGGGTANRTGASVFSYQNRVSIDLRCSVWVRYKQHIAEIMRIIEGKYLAPGGGYTKLVPLGNGNDLSDKTRLLFRRVIDVSIEDDLKEFVVI